MSGYVLMDSYEIDSFTTDGIVFNSYRHLTNDLLTDPSKLKLAPRE